jgi:hypothetical protein
LPSVLYLQNNISPAWNKTNDHKPSLLSKGIKQESLLSQNAAVWKYIDQQIKMLLAAKLTIQNIK